MRASATAGQPTIRQQCAKRQHALGKILRIDVDHPDTVAGTAYSSPSDNPYFGATPGRDEIFSIGWRNPGASALIG